MMNKSDGLSLSGRSKYFDAKEKPCYLYNRLDVEAMKEKCSKRLLGEDVTGGCKGIQVALALSNAITRLANMS